MPQSSTLDIGLPVHKEAIAVASVATAHGAEVLDLGTMGTRQCDIDQLVRQLHSQAQHLVLVEDAGPCGSWLSRSLTPTGQVGDVVAPALMPQKAGERVNTDRGDAVPLACLRRAGDLTPVDVPMGEDEAMRDLSRARDDAIHARKAAKCRLKAFLLRPDLRSTGRATWGPAHLRGLSAVGCPTPAPQIVFQEDVRAVTEPTARLPRLAQARQDQVPRWRLAPVVDALQGRRGGPCTVAVTTGAARGDLTRVDTPRQRLRERGLTPSASARGAPRRPGGMTTTGHPQARRARSAGAWAYR
jgi:transposase